MNKINIDELSSSTDVDSIVSDFLNNNNLDIEFHYGSNFKNAKILRDFMESICKTLDIEGSVQPRIVLVADELNNNSIEYGSKEDEVNIMRVSCRVLDGGVDLNVEVEDTGNGLGHKTASEMEELRKTRLQNGFDNYTSIRGRGLFLIILSIVDDLYFKDSDKGGLIVGVRKNTKTN